MFFDMQLEYHTYFQIDTQLQLSEAKVPSILPSRR